MTLSSLVISNTTFLISTGVEISQISSFINKFIIIFYFGEVIGSVLSFPFSEVIFLFNLLLLYCYNLTNYKIDLW